MNAKIILTKEQRAALYNIRAKAEAFKQAARALDAAWLRLEETDSPIGFMDMLYPFNEGFEATLKSIDIWVEDINTKSKLVTQ